MPVGRVRADAASQLGGSGASGPIHRGAAQGRRVDGIYAPEIGPSSALIANGSLLRARARALQRQIAWARNARQTYVANAVGQGITPKFRYQPETWGREARALWDEWVPVADASGCLDYYGLQQLVVAEVFEAGEVLIRRRTRRPEDALPVPLQLQVLESEHLPFWYTMPLPGGGWIKAGIEFDAIGRRVAYWLYPEHPGEFATSLAMDAFTLKRIPAEQIIHVFVPERAESIRGTPHLARSILRLFGLDEYDDAELDRQRMAAMVSGVITLLDPEKAADKVGILDSHQDWLDARGGGPFTEMEPGTVPILGPGEDFKPFNPAEIGTNYLPFHDHNLRAVAADAGLTYEMLTGDLSKSSYVSLRFGSLEFRRRCRLFQKILNFQFDRQVLGWWMDLAVMAGELAAPGYAVPRQRRAYQSILWVPPAWDRIQPDKEVPADIAACRAGFTSIDRVVAERTGEDGATLHEEIADINARIDRLGLTLDADPRVEAQAAAAKAEQAAAAAVDAATAADDDGDGADPKSETEDTAEAPTGTDR